MTNGTPDNRESRHFIFVREFASVVSLLQDKAAAAIDITNDIAKLIEELGTCAFDSESFSGLLNRIQKTIDHLNLENYSNLDAWVASLNQQIDGVLSDRLVQAVEGWCIAFSQDDGGVNGDTTAKKSIDEGTKMHIEPLVHEIRIRNQIIYLDPPIEIARQEWLVQFQSAIGVVCELTRIRSSRYEISLKAQKSAAEETSYMGLLTTLADGVLERPLSLIEAKVQVISEYVDKWLQFQNLWDLELDYIHQVSFTDERN